MRVDVADALVLSVPVTVAEVDIVTVAEYVGVTVGLTLADVVTVALSVDVAETEGDTVTL